MSVKMLVSEKNRTSALQELFEEVGDVFLLRPTSLLLLKQAVQGLQVSLEVLMQHLCTQISGSGCWSEGDF